MLAPAARAHYHSSQTHQHVPQLRHLLLLPRPLHQLGVLDLHRALEDAVLPLRVSQLGFGLQGCVWCGGAGALSVLAHMPTTERAGMQAP